MLPSAHPQERERRWVAHQLQQRLTRPFRSCVLAIDPPP